MRTIRFLVPVIIMMLSAGLAFAGDDTAFTYQGRLLDEGHPANGLFDLRFGLFSTESGGVPIDAVAPDKTSVTDGFFTVQIDFGADAFDNTERWLEITVSEITLSPRQPITMWQQSTQRLSTNVDHVYTVTCYSKIVSKFATNQTGAKNSDFLFYC